ncbi:hypothetical protein SPRG_12828 [Saprolegnia parasitica CBS 223.65]|uniref:Uncharacterized protein n=2 Tax=Saprolegnia parasitica (strain CBS 223.65) TaxID=695850 RepID=A0A067C563_SAPPC|nr:hypothetical protein SPRG_12828 [Saprolegnia parasitica CBS 223.65]KDO21962.1 hypothetical protein SPRG_12828 [Saprolegnia parasitica CBS 223.65]|eukprot:XP_012207304.1 hypothetical protein SPRG_12828 [Saprolegnia parasitica CBS 223.65]
MPTDATTNATTTAADAAPTEYIAVATPKAGAATTLDTPTPAHEKGQMVPLTKLFSYAERTDVLLMVGGTLCAMGTGVSQPLQIVFFGDILSAFNPGATTNTNVGDAMRDGINSIALKFVYLGIGVIACGFGQVACWSIAASRQGKRLKFEYIRAILRQEIGWFDVNKPMELATKVADTSLIIQDGIGRKVGDGINFFSMGISGIIIGLVKGWKLALALLAFTPFIALTAFLMVKTLSSAIQMGISAYASAGGIAEESLSNIRTVQMFNSMDKFVAKYDVSLLATEKAGIRKGIAIGLGTGVMFGTIFFTYAFGMWFGAVQVADDQLGSVKCTSDCYDGGRVLTVFFSIIMGAMALGQSGPSIQAVFSARTAAYGVFAMIERTSQVDPLDDAGATLPHVEGEIRLENIEFYYPARPDVRVCSGYTLQIAAGEKVALVGPSGSGKSTIVSLLERFYDPTRGTVYLDGVDLKTLNVKWLRQQVGLVGQEPSLFSVSIAENIRHGKDGATMDEIIAAAKQANAYDFIMSFPKGFDTEVGDRGAQLSGGQKQRIAIARAIIKNPAILLLDEATSALDTESERVVQESLDMLLSTRKRTTIIIAHRLSTIRDADRIVVLEKGVVVEQGSHTELIARADGHYRKLVEAQSRAHTKKDTPEDEPVDAMVDVAADTPAADARRMSSAKALVVPPSHDAAKADTAAVYQVPMSRVWKLSAPETGHILLGSLGAVVNGAIFPVWGVLLTKVTVLFFDYSLSGDEMRTRASHWALGFVGLGVAFCVSVVVQNYGFAVVAERLTHRLRYMGFKAMLHQDIGWFDLDANASGALTTRLATDTAMIMAMTSETLNRGLVNVATLGVAFGIGFYYSWEMTLAMLGIFPILGAASYVQMQMMSGHGKALNEGDTKAGSLLAESINSVRTVASFTMESNVHQTYLGHLATSAAADVKAGLGGGIGFGVSQGVMFMAIAFLFWLGGVLITRENSSTTFEDMFMVMMAIMLSSFGVGMAAQNMTDAAKAKVAAASLFETVDRLPPIDCASENGATLPTVRGEIELRNVRFSYPSRPNAPIYTNYSLRIPSGATVVRAVRRSPFGFYDPSAGAVYLDGVDIKSLNVKWLRQHISLVGQEPVLFAGSIADNIAAGKDGATRDDVVQAATMANAHDFILQFPDGYETQVGDRGVQVSGGQKQRIAIARAILRDPEVLLLDEATSALDNESERIVQASLDKLLQLKKRTTIIVAHRLTTIQNADIIAVASNGVIAEKGTHHELMKIPNGLYAALVSRQMQQPK